MKKTFYSNGKLLITGEYTVLDGATALALPTKHGQSLEITPNDKDSITWTAFDADGTAWLEIDLPISAIIENKPSGSPEAEALVKILNEAHLSNPTILENGFEVVTKLTFPRKWGLGTSSTLINNIAQWFGIDPYMLLAKTFGGSGYDIACAQNNTPILYRLENGRPVTEPVAYRPEFTENIYFVYLNQKQNSREAIATYREHRSDIAPVVLQISELTASLLKAPTAAAFSLILESHETIMSGILRQPTVKEKLFPDFDGTVKSLGAWGGDFVMAVSGSDPTDYFISKGYKIVIPYEAMIL